MTENTDDSYSNERIVGHRVDADTASVIGDAYTTVGGVRIREGDVSWDDSRTVRLTLDELEAIYEQFVDSGGGLDD